MYGAPLASKKGNNELGSPGCRGMPKGLAGFHQAWRGAQNSAVTSRAPYLDEQTFRFNNRQLSDDQRFWRAAKGIIGKRVTYVQLTGAEVPTT